jgi:hypothetical protein
VRAQSGAGAGRNVDRDSLARLWDANLPIAEIACHFGITYKRTQLLARRYGLRKRTQRDSARGRSRNYEPSREEIDSICLSFQAAWSEHEKALRRGGYLSR